MISYYRLSGAGNDFLALVEPARPPGKEEIRAWCRRGVSLGADGLFVLSRTSAGAHVVHHNADGGRSGLCLNGSRCAAQLAFALGWGHADELRLETDSGILGARRIDERTVALELPPIVGAPAPAALEVGGRCYDGWAVEVGVPHLVLPWRTGLGGAPVGELGPALRAHPDLGPAGANVDFVRFFDRRFEIRTFERGVEAETLACGTGVVAAAAAGVAAGYLEPPVRALTAGGFELEVAGAVEDGLLRRTSLAGDARVVARGEVLPEPTSVPAPPAWS